MISCFLLFHKTGVVQKYKSIIFDIFRTNSVKELEAFAENAVAVNRMILRHLSISEAYAPPVFNLAHAFPDDEFAEKTPRFAIGDDDGPGGIMIGEGAPLNFQFFPDSDGDTDSLSASQASQSSQWLGLSPPGQSRLARRRAMSRASSEEEEEPGSSDNTEGDKKGATGGSKGVKSSKPRSPPKSPSAVF